MTTKPSRLRKSGPWVVLDDEPICLIQTQGLTLKEHLKAHLEDQRAYIKRLTDRADKIEAFLSEKA